MLAYERIWLDDPQVVAVCPFLLAGKFWEASGWPWLDSGLKPEPVYTATRAIRLQRATATAATATTGLAITPDGTWFVLNSKPHFLKGISYFGYGSGPETAGLKTDLDAIQRCGINWLRLWVTWNEWSMLTVQGELVPAQATRLTSLLAELERRGLAADLTMNRESDSGKAMNCGAQKCGGLADQAAHLRGVRALAKLTLPFRGVYFDVANEHDVL